MAIKKANINAHSDQMIEGLLLVLHSLIPNALIQCQTVSSMASRKKLGRTKKGLHGAAGFYNDKGVCSIWFDLSHGKTCLLHVSREHVTLTQNEAELLRRIPDALSGLLVIPSTHALQLAQRIAARVSLDTILIARYLRDGHAASYWTPALIIEELQRLTFRRYESSPCTTGFVFSSKPCLYLNKTPIPEYEFIRFEKPVTMKVNKLESPASYRYVNGQNSFYLIDNHQKIHGFFTATDSNRYGLIERASCIHIHPLIRRMSGRVWAAFVGRNDDVNILASGKVHLRWDGNYWHLRDMSILTSILKEHGCSQKNSEQLAMVCLALSDLRSGTVLLVPNDQYSLPKSVGYIDDSDLGEALREALLNQSLHDLISSNSILGVLTSDGLTTISKKGTILSCGEIVDIAGETKIQPTGGGRTHAAVAASTHGLAIKVSEDGPISIYKNGVLLIKM